MRHLEIQFNFRYIQCWKETMVHWILSHQWHGRRVVTKSLQDRNSDNFVQSTWTYQMWVMLLIGLVLQGVCCDKWPEGDTNSEKMWSTHRWSCCHHLPLSTQHSGLPGSKSCQWQVKIGNVMGTRDTWQVWKRVTSRQRWAYLTLFQEQQR